MDAANLLERYWQYITAGVGGAFIAWKALTADANTKAEAKRRDRHELIKIAQEAAGAVIADLRAEIERLQAELEQLRKEYSVMLASKDAEITLLRGDLRQKEQVIHSLTGLLLRNNIPVPEPSQAYWQVNEEGDLLALIPKDMRE